MPEPLSDEPTSVEVFDSEIVYRGNVWNIVKDRFRLEGDEISREYMSHTGAVAVLALDERDRVLVIKQYRHPIGMRDWELPAGLLDVAGESPLVAARRELEEEADLVAETWDLLGEFSTTSGGSNEVVRIFLARGVSAAAEVYARTEEEAGIEVRWVPLDDIIDGVLSRELQNSILMIGALLAQAGRARGWQNLGPADAAWPRHPLERQRT
jgi:ADP-ribose pyrophosphatase